VNPTGESDHLRADGDAIRSALRVSYVAIAWSTVSGAAAIGVAVRTASLSLVGVGTTVLIDVVSSIVLVWRFRQQRWSHHVDVHIRAERRAQLVASTGLLVLGVALVATGVQHVAAGEAPDVDVAAIVLPAVSIVVLVALAAWKYRAAAAVASVALRTDAHISVVGATTSALALVGLGLSGAYGWAWPDPTAAIVIGAVAANEGRRALQTWQREGITL